VPPKDCPPTLLADLSSAKKFMRDKFGQEFGPAIVNEDAGENFRAQFKPVSDQKKEDVNAPTQVL
jgi:hypothetical protein